MIETTERNPYWAFMLKTDHYCVSTNGLTVRLTIKGCGMSWDFQGDKWLKQLEDRFAEEDLSYLPKEDQTDILRCINEVKNYLSAGQ
ncbi:MAG: hypothetical protein AB1489_38795 [Acidobacteriota bacterium]